MAYRKIEFVGDPIVFEKVAGGTIKPGLLVKCVSATVVVHATAAGNAEKLWALTPLVPVNGAADVDKSYVSGEIVPVGAFHAGQIVIARLSNGESVVEGDLLESNGDGYLQKHVADSTGIYYPQVIVGYAAEAKDMSGSTAVDPSDLFQVRVA